LLSFIGNLCARQYSKTENFLQEQISEIQFPAYFVAIIQNGNLDIQKKVRFYLPKFFETWNNLKGLNLYLAVNVK